MHIHRILMSVAVLVCAAIFCGLSPEVQRAIGELSSDDFKTRQAAVEKLQLAMGRQMRAMIVSDDPEAQARLTSLLHFQDGLARWAIDVMKLPEEQRKAQLAFGLREDVLPVIAGVFSNDTDKRVEGIKALGKFDAPEATAMLARLIEDTDRHVYIAAMEAVWDRTPTQAVVDALWQRAIEVGFAGQRPQAAPAATAPVFRGRTLASYTAINRIYHLPQDAGIAGEVLVNLRSPLVGEKLDAFMPTIENLSKTNPWLLNNNNSEYIKNVFRLVSEYKTPTSLQILYRLATVPTAPPMAGTINNEKHFRSARTAPLAALIEAVGQKPEDYRLKRLAPLGNSWTFPAEQDETDAIKKLNDWLSTHGKKLGIPNLSPPPRPAEPATQSVSE